MMLAYINCVVMVIYYYMKKRPENQPIIRRLCIPAAIVSVIAAILLLSAVIVRGIQNSAPAEVPQLTAAQPAGQAVFIDINTADAETLQLLPDIGPALAQAIIDDREENGPFLSPDDITRVYGIGPATAESIAPYITCSEAQ